MFKKIIRRFYNRNKFMSKFVFNNYSIEQKVSVFFALIYIMNYLIGGTS